MATGNEEGGSLPAREEGGTEEHPFDLLTRASVCNSLSRRQALKLVGTTVLGTALGLPLLAGQAQARRRRRADLVPVPQSGIPGPVGFCRIEQGKLVVTIKNQGKRDAPSTTTRVSFSSGQSSAQKTPPIPAGGSVDVRFSIPSGCFSPDCGFTIEADSKKQVKESDEANNTAFGSCLG
jgi:hypothetical protein